MLFLHHSASLVPRNHQARHCEPRSAAEWEAISSTFRAINRCTAELVEALSKPDTHVCIPDIFCGFLAALEMTSKSFYDSKPIEGLCVWLRKAEEYRCARNDKRECLLI